MIGAIAGDIIGSVYEHGPSLEALMLNPGNKFHALKGFPYDSARPYFYPGSRLYFANTCLRRSCGSE